MWSCSQSIQGNLGACGPYQPFIMLGHATVRLHRTGHSLRPRDQRVDQGRQRGQRCHPKLISQRLLRFPDACSVARKMPSPLPLVQAILVASSSSFAPSMSMVAENFGESEDSGDHREQGGIHAGRVFIAYAQHSHAQSRENQQMGGLT